MPLVAGVDSSTSACKVEVRDADTGTVVATGRAPHPPTTPPRSEQHPDAWWTAFAVACEQADVHGRHRPAAISIAGQQHGLVVLDVADEVLRPAKLWNDTESARDAEALVQAIGCQAWADASGSVPRVSFTITKLAWLRRVEPDVFRRVARVLLPHDWLTWRLTGAPATDRGDASGTGWWSPAEGRDRFDLLALVDPDLAWDSIVPQVLAPTAVAGEWEGIVVGPGTGDNMAAALGLGLRPGGLALSLGTSGTAFTVSDSPTNDGTGTVAGFADATGRFLPLVCTLNATKVTDTIARLLGVDASGLDALALAATADVGGPLLVPHLDGERTPDRPDATGALVGIRTDMSREQLARAAIDGVVCNLLDAAEHLPVAPGDGPVLLVGGGARSGAYHQAVADLSGRPVLVPDDDELVARGAALQAAAVLQGSPSEAVAEAWGDVRGTMVDPRPGIDREALRSAFSEASAAAESRPGGP